LCIWAWKDREKRIVKASAIRSLRPLAEYTGLRQREGLLNYVRNIRSLIQVKTHEIDEKCIKNFGLKTSKEETTGRNWS
jgi:hypothetical protein